MIWPAGIALDSLGNVYVTDEWLNRVSVFDREGNYLTAWGSSGDADGSSTVPPASPSTGRTTSGWWTAATTVYSASPPPASSDPLGRPRR